jgi:4-amino-4-deoxy-L-arabinose transferase
MRSGNRFCLAWIALPLALLSLSSGKLPTYVLPLFPPASALVAVGLLRWREGRASSRDAGTMVALVIVRVLALACVALAVLGGDRLGLPRLWTGAEWSRWLLLAVAFVAWSLLESRAHRTTSAPGWLARMAWVPVPVLLCVHLLFPTALVAATKAPWDTLQRHDAALREATRVIVNNTTAHPVNWSTGRTDLILVGDPNEFDNELRIESERARFISHAELLSRVREWLGSGSVAIALDAASVQAIVKAMPERVRVREVDRELGIVVLSPTR